MGSGAGPESGGHGRAASRAVRSVKVTQAGQPTRSSRLFTNTRANAGATNERPERIRTEDASERTLQFALDEASVQIG